MFLDGRHDIFAAASMADVAVLRSMGFAAVPATGLRRLRGRVLDDFCGAMKLPAALPKLSLPTSKRSTTWCGA